MNEYIIRSSRKRLQPRIDLTALVDGVFNLLIFFAVTSSIAGAHAGLALKLPKAATAERLRGQIIVSIMTGDRVVHIDTQQVALGDLGAEITRRSGGDLETQVVVRPDKDVRYERIVAVMDEVRLAGYHNLALAVVKKRGP